MSDNNDNLLPYINFLGVSIFNGSRVILIDFIINRITSKKSCLIFTPNPEIIVKAINDKEYLKLLDKADILIPDGIGIVIGSRILGKKIQEKITGIDLMEELCQIAENKGWKIFLLGGRSKVSGETAFTLQKKHPKLNIIGSYEGNSDIENDKITQEFVIRLCKNQHIDLIFVAYGAPNQEKWIIRNYRHLPATLFMGVGGSFDYISGSVQRAPKCIQKIGFEWLYRLIKQPWRWKRQLNLLTFIWLVLKKRIFVSFLI